MKTRIKNYKNQDNMNAHVYNVNLKSVNGRISNMTSPELKDALDVVTPQQFPDGVEGMRLLEHFVYCGCL